MSQRANTSASVAPARGLEFFPGPSALAVAKEPSGVDRLVAEVAGTSWEQLAALRAVSVVRQVPLADGCFALLGAVDVVRH